MGPIKIFDTAGADEAGALGSKKLEKTVQALKESDVVIVVIDAFSHGGRAAVVSRAAPAEGAMEQRLVEMAMEQGKSILVLFNTKDAFSGRLFLAFSPQ